MRTATRRAPAAQVCVGKNLDGSGCRRRVTDPTGLCADHRKNAAKAGAALPPAALAAPAATPPADPLLPEKVEVVEAEVVLAPGDRTPIPTPREMVASTGAGAFMADELAELGLIDRLTDADLASAVATAEATTALHRRNATIDNYAAHIAEVDRALVDRFGVTRDQIWREDGMPAAVLLVYLADVTSRAQKHPDLDPDEPYLPLPERQPCAGEVADDDGQRRECKNSTDHPSGLCRAHLQRAGGRITAATIRQRMSAISHAHRQHFPDGADPTKHPKVTAFLRGYASSEGSAPDGKGEAPPLRADALVKIVSRMGAEPHTPLADRDAALVELACDDERRLSMNALTRLEWSQVSLVEGGGVELKLGGDPVVLDPYQAAAVRRLRGRFHGVATGPVFRRYLDPDDRRRFRPEGISGGYAGEGISHVTAKNIVAGRLAAAGIALPARGAPKLDRQARHAAADRIVHPAVEVLRSIDHRDRFLLTTGFWRASRRRNLVDLEWRDLKVVTPSKINGGGGLDVCHRVSKTRDDASWGAMCPTPPPDHPWAPLDPVAAHDAWKAEWTRIVGRKPGPNDPVFLALDSAGNPRRDNRGQLKRIARPDVNRIVADRAEAAGEPPDEGGHFTAHSLRRGRATTMSEAGLSTDDIQDVTEHKTAEMARHYVDNAHRLGKGDRKLFGWAMSDGAPA